MRHWFQSLIALAVCFSASLCSQAAYAQDEIATATKEATAQTQQQAERALTVIKKAIKGDSAAIQQLTNEYVFPGLIALGIVILGYFVASFFARIVGGAVSKKVDVTLGRFFNKAIKALIMTLVLLSVLNHFGVDVTSFAAILAAVGFAVGMALQGTLSNLASGVMLLIFRPFKVDHYIQVADVEGKVEAIDLFTTQLNTPDNRHLIVPNSQIFGSTITNYNRNSLRRVNVDVGVDYEADVDRTRAVIDAVMGQVPDIVADPAPQSVLTELADSSVNWQARVWCKPEDYWAVKEKLTVLLKKGLDLNGIGIPYPQLVLHKATDEAKSARSAA